MSMMDWIPLTEIKQLDSIQRESVESPVLLFKHSTTCSISNTALNRLERNWKTEELQSVKTYLLDLRSYRAVSNEIAQLFSVVHESPQVLIIQNGKSVYHSSHFDIDYTTIKNTLTKIKSLPVVS